MRLPKENNAEQKANPNDRINLRRTETPAPETLSRQLRISKGGQIEQLVVRPGNYSPPDLGFIGGGAVSPRCSLHRIRCRRRDVGRPGGGLLLTVKRRRKIPELRLIRGWSQTSNALKSSIRAGPAYKDLLDRARECYESGDFDRRLSTLQLRAHSLDKAPPVNYRGKTTSIFREGAPNTPQIRLDDSTAFGVSSLEQGVKPASFRGMLAEVSSFQ